MTFFQKYFVLREYQTVKISVISYIPIDVALCMHIAYSITTILRKRQKYTWSHMNKSKLPTKAAPTLTAVAIREPTIFFITDAGFDFVHLKMNLLDQSFEAVIRHSKTKIQNKY